jgi:hypothetical protein
VVEVEAEAFEPARAHIAVTNAKHGAVAVLGHEDEMRRGRLGHDRANRLEHRRRAAGVERSRDDLEELGIPRGKQHRLGVGVGAPHGVVDREQHRAVEGGAAQRDLRGSVLVDSRARGHLALHHGELVAHEREDGVLARLGVGGQRQDQG